MVDVFLIRFYNKILDEIHITPLRFCIFRRITLYKIGQTPSPRNAFGRILGGQMTVASTPMGDDLQRSERAVDNAPSSLFKTQNKNYSLHNCNV